MTKLVLTYIKDGANQLMTFDYFDSKNHFEVYFQDLIAKAISKNEENIKIFNKELNVKDITIDGFFIGHTIYTLEEWYECNRVDRIWVHI